MSAAPIQVADRIREDRVRAEAWLSTHLWKVTGVDVQAGVTDPARRQARIRKLIADRGIADRIMGRFNGREETYRGFCLRALGLDL